MKIILVFLLTFSSFIAHAKDALEGEWKFVEIIMDDVHYPPPNPDLDLRFTFDGEKISRLYWTRADEVGFCDRLAIYSYGNEQLYQKIVWVNPHNDLKCAQDQDMQLGGESEIRAVRKNNQLFVDVQFGDKYVVYVFNKVSNIN